MIARQAHTAQPSLLERTRHDKASSKRFVVEERRLRERITDASLAVAFKGAIHTAANWSLGGFVIEGYRGPLTPGALLSIDAVGKAGGELTKVRVRARVVRSDGSQNCLAVSFLDMDSRAYKVLHEVMSERMRCLTSQNFR